MVILSKSEDGRVKGLTNIGRLIITVFTIVSMVIAGYVYMTCSMTAIAQDVSKEEVRLSEEKGAKSFDEVTRTQEMQQQILELKIKDLETKRDMDKLEWLTSKVDGLNNDLIIIKKQLEQNPDSDLLKQKQMEIEEEIKRKVDKIEQLEAKIDN
jgi:cell division protein FtsB